MYFMIEDKNIFDKYMIIWDNVSNIIRKRDLIVNLYVIKNI